MKKFIPYQFGISDQPLKPFDADEKKARKQKKLLQLNTAYLRKEFMSLVKTGTELKNIVVKSGAD